MGNLFISCNFVNTTLYSSPINNCCSTRNIYQLLALMFPVHEYNKYWNRYRPLYTGIRVVYISIHKILSRKIIDTAKLSYDNVAHLPYNNAG